MNNIYYILRKLARSVRAQNLFVVVKEINNIRLFKNSYDLSNLQNIYLSYLYNANMINNDIVIDKISKHVFDNEIYEDSYLLWKQKNNKKTDKENNKKNDVNLVVSRKINFPTRG